MSDDASPRLGLPYLAAAQAQKHVIVNEALMRLDGLVQTAVESRAVAAQPASPEDGAIYILPASPTGAAWTGQPPGAATDVMVWVMLQIEVSITAAESAQVEYGTVSVKTAVYAPSGRLEKLVFVPSKTPVNTYPAALSSTTL